MCAPHSRKVLNHNIKLREGGGAIQGRCVFIMPDIVGWGLAFILSQVGARQLGGGVNL